MTTKDERAPMPGNAAAPRIPPAAITGPDADTASVARISELRSGRISTLYRTLLHSGDIAAGWCALGTAVRWNSSLDDRLRELLTCYVARATDAAYEWEMHAPLARDTGVSQAQLDSLPRWRGCPTFDGRDRAALGFAEAVTDGTVDDDTFDRASAVFERRELVEIAATVSYYVAISHVLQACGVTTES